MKISIKLKFKFTEEWEVDGKINAKSYNNSTELLNDIKNQFGSDLAKARSQYRELEDGYNEIEISFELVKWDESVVKELEEMQNPDSDVWCKELFKELTLNYEISRRSYYRNGDEYHKIYKIVSTKIF